MVRITRAIVGITESVATRSPRLTSVSVVVVIEVVVIEVVTVRGGSVVRGGAVVGQVTDLTTNGRAVTRKLHTDVHHIITRTTFL